MNDAVKKMMAQKIARMALTGLGTYAIAHGLADQGAVDAVIGGASYAIVILWNYWDAQGRDELMKELISWRSNSAAKVAPKTTGLIIAGLLLLHPDPSHAQAPNRGPPRLTLQPPITITNAPAKEQANPFDKLNGELMQTILADVTYALARAKAANNTVTIGCWQAWVKLVSAQTSVVKDDAGNTLAEPSPHVFTDAELASEFINELQPNSDLNVGCGAALNASKLAVGQMIGAVLSGGALGLFKLPIVP